MNIETFSSPDEFMHSPVKTENASILMDIRMPGKTGFDLQQRLGCIGHFNTYYRNIGQR